MARLHHDPGLGLVGGTRPTTGRTRLRLLLSRACRLAIALAAPVPLRDVQCGHKALRCQAALAATQQPFAGRWLFDAELVRRVRRSGHGVAAAPLPTWVEHPGSHALPRHARALAPWGLRLARELLRLAATYRRR